MRTSKHLTHQEIMQCVVDAGPMSAQHMAMLERQKWAQARAEHHALLKAHPKAAASALAESTPPDGMGTRLSHWLGSRLVSAGHRLEGSTT